MKYQGLEANALKISFTLDKIICYKEGDGIGNAEPYLWPVFFKVDGETAEFEDSETLSLSGKASLYATSGSHGNLQNTKSVGAGETVQIPKEVGQWKTTLSPISVHGYDDLAYPAGVVGVFCILLEQDNMSDKGAIAGYRSLQKTIATGLKKIIPTLSAKEDSLSPTQRESLIAQVKESVQNEIITQQNLLQNILTWSNQDDLIGFECFIFPHSELQQKPRKQFSKRWKNEGDWQIVGKIYSKPTV